MALDSPSPAIAFAEQRLQNAVQLPLRPSSARGPPPLQEHDLGPRRTSVQFLPHVRTDPNDQQTHSRNISAETTKGTRLSSPPPPTKFRSRLSFDTYDNRDATHHSLTLTRKHKDYHYDKRSRTFLCGLDANDYSDTALEWLIDELIDDGDEIVCLRVVERDSKEARDLAALAAPQDARERPYYAEANRMLDHVQSKNTDDRAINIILEFAIGKVQDTFQSMIRIYEPAMLIVGTRGRSLSGFQGLMPGSISKYCLQYSPVPVIVVRPSSKRDKKKRKRLRDPSRHGYRDILDQSGDGEEGGHILDERNRSSLLAVQALSALGKHDEEEEARMVAMAIGYRPEEIGGLADDTKPLSCVVSNRSDTSGGRSVRSGSTASLASEKSTTNSPLVGRLTKSPDSHRPTTYSDDSDDQAQYVPLDAKEEALQRARERALLIEEEQRLEREQYFNENHEPETAQNRSRASTVDSTSDYQGGSGPLAALDALKAAAIEKNTMDRRKKRASR